MIGERMVRSERSGAAAMSIRATRLVLAAAAMGFGLAGSVLANNAAEASPLNGGRHPGHHGGWHPHGHGGPHLPAWGHHRPHGYFGHGAWGVVHVGYPHGPRCRLVERENRWGEIVLRRVCRRPAL
jgi:hypothetical protein